MTEKQLSYLAGFFDGEGYIRTPVVKNNILIDRNSFSVQVSQASKPVIELHKFLFGGSISEKLLIKKHHKIVWTWQCCSKSAFIFALLLYPYLLVKKDKTEDALILQRRYIKNYSDNDILLFAENKINTGIVKYSLNEVKMALLNINWGKEIITNYSIRPYIKKTKIQVRIIGKEYKNYHGNH